MKANASSSRSGVVWPLLVLLVTLVLILPRSPKFGYDYRLGDVWTYDDLVAELDFPLLKSDEEYTESVEEAENAVLYYYRRNADVVKAVSASLKDVDLGNSLKVKQTVRSAFSDIYSVGVLDFVPEEGADAVVHVIDGKKEIVTFLSSYLTVPDAQEKLTDALNQILSVSEVDSLMSATSLSRQIVPDVEFDRYLSQVAKNTRKQQVSSASGIIHANTVIVKNGQSVTSDLVHILDSYKAEYEKDMASRSGTFSVWTGNFCIALVLVLLIYLSIRFTNPKIFKDTRRYLYLLFIFLVATMAALVVGKAGVEYLYMVPFTLPAIYLQAFFKDRVILPFCMISLLPLLIFSQTGASLYVMFCVASVISLLFFRRFSSGWRQFIVGGLVYISLVIAFFGFRFIGATSGSIMRPLIFLFIGSALSVAGFPFIYLFEKMFNLVSVSRMQDLSDANSPLLRQLESTAPGTFQHSLQVAAMATAVARKVDANAALLRAAALYHDIGKMQNPQCFVENESLLRSNDRPGYHSALTPEQSAREIIGHVTGGYAIAKKNNIPTVIAEFILSHHGTTRAAYFYNKYVNDGGDPENVAPFTYPGPKPATKEQIILMLCDSIEAASRTLQEHTPEAFSKFVEGIVAAKMKEGQFDEAEITVREISIVKEEIKNYLAQLYHERIAYPDQKA